MPRPNTKLPATAVAPSTVEVSTEIRKNGEPVEMGGRNRTEKVKVPSGAIREIEVGSKFTKNLGNYESATITVSIRRPCADTDEAETETLNAASQRVDDFINEELEQLK